MEAFLRRKFEGLIRNVEHVDREDLDLVRAWLCMHVCE